MIPTLPSPVVCERSGRWAAALRVALARRNVVPSIVETRSPAELQLRIVDQRRRGSPLGMVVVELTAADVERVCSLLAWHVRFGDDVPTAVVTDDARGYEPIVRAAGANLFAASTRELQRIVDAYVAFAADASQRASSVNDDERSPTERIWSSLPFGSYPKS
jgi:hypothetical protein